jgi:AraC-like DNA-binding protein
MARRTGPRFARAAILIPFAREFDRRGGDVIKVLSDHHIAISVMEQPEVAVEASSIYAAIEDMAEALGDRYFGAAVAVEAAHHGTPMLRDAANGAKTFGDFLTRAIKETAERVDNVRYSLLITADRANFEIQRLLSPTGSITQVDAIGAAFYVTVFRLGLHQHFDAGKIVVTTPSQEGIPPSLLPRRALMKSAINGLKISFPSDWLLAPFSLHWTSLADLQVEPISQGGRFITQIYLQEKLKEHLSQENLNLKDFCKICRMHPRSFQRFLTENGTSFRQMRDELRRAMATDLLSNSDKTIAEVAARVGHSSPAAFDRAFKRWTGETPSNYRKTHGGLVRG